MEEDDADDSTSQVGMSGPPHFLGVLVCGRFSNSGSNSSNSKWDGKQQMNQRQWITQRNESAADESTDESAADESSNQMNQQQLNPTPTAITRCTH
jgi:hypothetical protein